LRWIVTWTALGNDIFEKRGKSCEGLAVQQTLPFRTWFRQLVTSVLSVLLTTPSRLTSPCMGYRDVLDVPVGADERYYAVVDAPLGLSGLSIGQILFGSQRRPSHRAMGPPSRHQPLIIPEARSSHHTTSTPSPRLTR
jgi:hypothetical protein